VRRLVLLLAVILVNLPAVHQAWTDHRITAEGRDVEATVLDSRTVNGHHLVDYRLPSDVDPDGTEFSARIDDASFARAVSSDVLAVRVLSGRPGANRPEGEVSSPILVVAALGADVIVLVIGALWVLRRRRPPDAETAGG
jgi:hypothetical protein